MNASARRHSCCPVHPHGRRRRRGIRAGSDLAGPTADHPADGAGLTAGGLNAHGDAIAAGTTVVGTRLRILVANRHGLASTWTRQTISGPLNGSTGVASAINDAGAAVVLWQTPVHNVTSAVRTSRTRPWRVLGVPSGAAARDNSGFLDGSVAMTANGQASAIWYAKEQAASTVRSAFRSGPNAVWRAMPALTPSAPSGSSVVGIHVAGDAAGDAVAAWSVLPNGGTTSTIYVATRSGHRPWTAPHAMPDTDLAVGGWVGDLSRGPSVGIAPNGRVAVAWTADTSTDAAIANVGVDTGNARTGAWGLAQPLAPGGLPSIAINSHGTLAAVWTQPLAHDFMVADLRAAMSPTGATWSVPQTLHRFNGQENYDYGHVVLGESGRSVATSSWHNSGPDYEGLLMSSGPNGIWTDAFTGPVFAWPSVTLNAAGDALAVAAGTHAVFGVSYDAVPRPKLAVHATPVWLPGHRQIRWTVRVTDVGPVTARNVALSVSWIGGSANLVSAAPAGSRTPLGRAWRLGTLSPGRSSSVRVVVRVPQRWARYIWGQTSAVGLATHTFQVTAPA